MKPADSPTQGQPNPRKKWVKSRIWATFSHVFSLALSPYIFPFLLLFLFIFTLLNLMFIFICVLFLVFLRPCFCSLSVYRGSWRMYVVPVVAQHNGMALYYYCCLQCSCMCRSFVTTELVHFSLG